MSESKNHHYVPAFYLNNWGDVESTQKYKRVSSFGYNNGRFIANDQSTKHLCSQMQLYSTEEDVLYNKYIEDRCKPIMNKILNEGIRSLNNYERSDWTKFIISMRIRHPTTVHWINDNIRDIFNRSIIPELKEEMKNSARKYEDFYEFAEEHIPDIKNDLLSNNTIRVSLGKNETWAHEHIHKMHWSIINFNEATRTLLTSDNPLIITPANNIRDKECIIYLPLNPVQGFFATNTYEAKELVNTQVKSNFVKMVNKSILLHGDTTRVIANDLSQEKFIREHFKSTNATQNATQEQI